LAPDFIHLLHRPEAVSHRIGDSGLPGGKVVCEFLRFIIIAFAGMLVFKYFLSVFCSQDSFFGLPEAGNVNGGFWASEIGLILQCGRESAGEVRHSAAEKREVHG